jgi:hypothetical protein
MSAQFNLQTIKKIAAVPLKNFMFFTPFNPITCLVNISSNKFAPFNFKVFQTTIPQTAEKLDNMNVDNQQEIRPPVHSCGYYPAIMQSTFIIIKEAIYFH